MIEEKLNFIDKIRNFSISSEEKIAIHYNNTSITYKKFVAAYDIVASSLVKNKIKQYHRIAVLVQNDLVSALISLPILENAVLIHFDPDLSRDGLESMLNLLKIDYIVSDVYNPEWIEISRKFGMGFIRIDSSKETQIEKLVLQSELATNLLKRNESTENLVTMKTTSGTTNIPKIVPITAKMYMTAAQRYIEIYGMNKDDNTLIVTRMYKTLSFSTTLRTLYTGGTVILTGGINHIDFTILLTKYNITNVAMPPAILSSYSRYIEKHKIKPIKNNLRYARTSGAPLSQKLKDNIEEFLGVRLDQSYGMTETYNISGTFNQPKGYRNGSAGVSGEVEIKILNKEILVKGDSVFKGYENDEIDNDEYFSDGWFHTGDLGHIDEDGYIYVLGRKKEMINRGGEKISPYEVESVILVHPKIKDAVVFPYPNDYGSENAGVAVIVEDISEINLINLRKFLKGKIDVYKMPTKIFIVNDIPIAESGKIQRRELYDFFVKLQPDNGKKTNRSKISNLSDTEKKILKIWKSTLKTQIKDRNATFSDLGGDSLNGAIVLADIDKKLGVSLPVDILFDDGTLEGIADYIDKNIGIAENFEHIVPIKAEGNKKPLICVHSGTGDATTYRYIGKNIDKDRPVYGLRFDAHSFKDMHPLTFDIITREYADEIKRFDPVGPYNICGHCWGGILAYKLASTLIQDGCEINMLAMFDSAAKDRDISKIASKGNVRKRFVRTFRESFAQIRDKSLKRKIYLVFKKTGNILNLFKITQLNKLYRYGFKKNSRFLMNSSGKVGALGYANQEYLPVQYDGTIYFFKALRGVLGKSKNHTYWRKMAKDFKLYSMDCHHNDMVIGEDAKTISNMMDSIMEKSDA